MSSVPLTSIVVAPGGGDRSARDAESLDLMRVSDVRVVAEPGASSVGSVGVGLSCSHFERTCKTRMVHDFRDGAIDWLSVKLGILSYRKHNG